MNLSVLLFLHLKNGNNCTDFMRLMTLNELAYVKCLEQCLKCHVNLATNITVLCHRRNENYVVF